MWGPGRVIHGEAAYIEVSELRTNRARKVIIKMNVILAKLKLEKAEDKTQVGKIERGFDFLGYHFSLEGLSVATVSILRFGERVAVRLYEVRQSVANPYYGRRRNNKTPDSVSQYVQRWLKWVKSGLDDYAVNRMTAFT